MDTSNVISIASFTGLIIMMIAYFYTQARKGRNDATKDLNVTTQEVIATYKEQVAQYKEQIEKYRKDMHDLTLKIGELTGMVAEKDKQNKELREFLLGRNPEIDGFYKKAVPLLDKVDKYINTNEPIFSRLAQYLEKEGVK